MTTDSTRPAEAPGSVAMVRYPIPGDSVFPEGITEGGGATFFVGSMDGTIFRGDVATGQVERFAVPPDGARTMLCGLDIDGYGRLIGCAYDSGELFAYSLASCTLVARRRLPVQEAWPNDVVVVGDSAYVTDTRQPLVWRLPVGAAEVGEPEVFIDLSPFGPADPAYLNGIVADPAGTVLLVASQGEGGTLSRVDLAERTAAPVEFGGYDFNADGMLLDGDVLYGVTNRGTSHEDVTFMISAARLAPGWRSGTIVAEIPNPGWDCPTTIAKVEGKMLVVCSQLHALRAKKQPHLPFEIASTDLPSWS
jgi:sugar lactone lactonase YvrE